MTHPLSLRDGHQGREVKSPDCRVGLIHEVVAEDNVNVPRANRPPEHLGAMLNFYNNERKEFNRIQRPTHGSQQLSILILG